MVPRRRAPTPARSNLTHEHGRSGRSRPASGAGVPRWVLIYWLSRRRPSENLQVMAASRPADSCKSALTWRTDPFVTDGRGRPRCGSVTASAVAGALQLGVVLGALVKALRRVGE